MLGPFAEGIDGLSYVEKIPLCPVRPSRSILFGPRERVATSCLRVNCTVKIFQKQPLRLRSRAILIPLIQRLWEEIDHGLELKNMLIVSSEQQHVLLAIELAHSCNRPVCQLLVMCEAGCDVVERFRGALFEVNILVIGAGVSGRTAELLGQREILCRPEFASVVGRITGHKDKCRRFGCCARKTAHVAYRVAWGVQKIK
jgi:hypothetical protein